MKERKVKPENSLLMRYPDIARCWDYDKNVGINPLEIYPTSKNDAFWKCPDCGAEWKQQIYSRTRSKCTCPHCQKEKRTSFNEQAILYYIKKFYPDVINNDRHLGLELDIYIPSISLAIEYDGEFAHGPKHPNSLERDLKKNDLCAKNNIKLIRIRELGSYDMKSDKNLDVYWINRNKKSDFENVLKRIFKTFIKEKIDINLKRDEQNITLQYKNLIKENSLAFKFPQLLKEFDYKKNKMKPETIPYGSSMLVWWICPKCGKSYLAQVRHRTNPKRPTGCPYCASRSRFQPGINDLETWCRKNNRLDILLDWDKAKNKGIMPKNVHQGAKTKYHFKCHICGYEYSESPSHKTTGGHACLNCVRLKQSKKVKCIETGKIFSSIAEATKFCGLKSCSTLSDCLKNKNKTAGGYHWEQVS